MNLTGASLFTREAARVMDNGASIVNIASQAAKTGFRQMAPYVSSKHGMIGLTRTAAIDLASKGIRVSAVCPNHMTTTVGKAQSEYFSSHRGWPEAYRAQISEHIPLGRVGRLEDTAAAVAFLASDEAAFMTSEALNVSGGEETHSPRAGHHGSLRAIAHCIRRWIGYSCVETVVEKPLVTLIT